MTDQNNVFQTTEKPKARAEFDAWLKRVGNAPLYWNRSNVLLATFVAGHAVTLSKLRAPVLPNAPKDTQEFKLWTMARSYAGGHSRDRLGSDCAMAAPNEIRTLRATLSAVAIGKEV